MEESLFKSIGWHLIQVDVSEAFFVCSLPNKKTLQVQKTQMGAVLILG